MLQVLDPETGRLDEWRLEGPLSREQAARLEEDELFAVATQQFFINMASLRKVSAALEGMFKDAGHYVAALLAIYLHASGGLTMKRLREFCVTSGYLSPGRARALLIYMQYLRFVELLPTRRGTSAHYMPTGRFIEAWRLHLRLALEALEPFAPDIADLLDRFDDEGVLERFVTAHCEYLMQATTVPEYQLEGLEKIFLHRRAGHCVIYALLGADASFGPPRAIGGSFPNTWPVTISVASLARELGVSRLHISRMLDDAEAENFIECTPDGSIGWSTSAREKITRWSSGQLVCLLRAAADTAGAIVAPRSR